MQPPAVLVEGDQRRRRVEQHRVAHRPRLAGEQPPDDLGVDRGVAAAQAPRSAGARCRARSGRPAPASPRRRAPPRPTTWSSWSARRGRRRPGTPARGVPRPASTAAITGAIRRVGAADRGGRRAGRVGQRAEEVEDRADAQLAAGRGGVPERRGGRPARSRSRCRPPRRSGRPRRRAGRSRRRAPRARRPHREADDAARLPCLTTGTPAAAVTTAAIVEMLTVCAPSPPVPTMSTHGQPAAAPASPARASWRPARPPRRASRPWRAARPRTRRPGRRWPRRS